AWDTCIHHSYRASRRLSSLLTLAEQCTKIAVKLTSQFGLEKPCRVLHDLRISNRHSCFASAELRMISPRCELVSQAPPLAHLLAIVHTVYIGSQLSALRVGGICHLFSVAVILEARPGDSRTCICVTHHLLCDFRVIANRRDHIFSARLRYGIRCRLIAVGISIIT